MANKLRLVTPRKFMKAYPNIPWEACITWNRTHQDVQAEYYLLAQDTPGRNGFKGRQASLACAIALLWEDEGL